MGWYLTRTVQQPSRLMGNQWRANPILRCLAKLDFLINCNSMRASFLLPLFWSLSAFRNEKKKANQIRNVHLEDLLKARISLRYQSVCFLCFCLFKFRNPRKSSHKASRLLIRQDTFPVACYKNRKGYWLQCSPCYYWHDAEINLTKLISSSK